MKQQRRSRYSPEFRLEAAQLVVDHGQSIREAADAMDVDKSTMDKWVRQLWRLKGHPPLEKRILKGQ
jgi:transposase